MNWKWSIPEYVALFCLQAVLVLPLLSQDAITSDTLDPARDPSHLAPPAAKAWLPEQYIWTRPATETDALPGRTPEWVFRRVFQLQTVPPQATLYVAASGDADVWLNGVHLLAYTDDRTLRAGYTVHALDATAVLRSGANALAIRLRNLHGAHHTTTDPLTLQFVGGRALAVKLLPAERGVETTPLLMSDQSWKGRQQSANATDTRDDEIKSISSAEYGGDAWPTVASLGGIESNIDFFQWNADAGMYAWPGYVGASPFLRHYSLQAAHVLHVLSSASLEHIDRLTQPPSHAAGTFSVRVSPQSASEQSPALTLDFGREVAGRIHLQSASDSPILVTAAYGESEDEALYQPFLGVRTIYIPPHGDAWGPKSAFRFVRLQFQSDGRFASIDLDGIAYPAEYKGSFSSSDPRLERIWATGAHTAHLCMQDGMWDGVKRDRARWAGDIDVSSRVVNDVFADRALLVDTFARLIAEAGETRHVNGIAGYSALWIRSVAEFHRHSGDHDFLLRMHSPLLGLLKTMDREIGPGGTFAPSSKTKVFVDWSPGLSDDTPEARRATEFEYVLGYKEAAWLLAEMGDQAASGHYAARYEYLRQNARRLLMDPMAHTFGATWQTNAMAVLSGAALESDYPLIWNRIFANLDKVTKDSPSITPYYGYYVLQAMAMLGHRSEALQWVRNFWGGMIDEGATSFWESYDPRWPKHHESLQADGRTGYYVSLAHAWSVGPTVWLMEELAGIRSTGAGFRTATIQPELAGLEWVDGSVPAPGGIIHVRAQRGKIMLDLPRGLTASVLIRTKDNPSTELNGVMTTLRPSQIPGYGSLLLGSAGHYEITSK